MGGLAAATFQPAAYHSVSSTAHKFRQKFGIFFRVGTACLLPNLAASLRFQQLGRKIGVGIVGKQEQGGVGVLLQFLTECFNVPLQSIFAVGNQELEKFMMDEALLFTDEGYLFGESGQGFERINLACPTWVLEEALNRLDAAWKRRCAT